MKEFYFSPNFNKNELLSAAVHKLAAAPVSPVEALFYYDTVTKAIYFYNGTVWTRIKDGVITAAEVTFNPASTTLVATTVQAALEEIRANSPKNNSTTSSPLVTDDTTQGYRALSIWMNTATSDAFICLNPATGAAVWKSFIKQPASDISFDNTASTIVATNVQAALTEAGTRINALEGTTHTQNTDTGTTQVSFQINSSGTGPRLKNNGGVLEVRNAADSAYADLHVRNLTIDGDITEIASNRVTTGDNEIVLNNDILLRANNSDGLFSVKRLDTDDTTRLDASLKWSESAKRWRAIYGDTVLEKTISLVHAENIGDGAAIAFVVSHNLNSRDVSVAVYRNSSPWEDVGVEVERTSLNTVTIRFSGYVPTANEFRVVVQG